MTDLRKTDTFEKGTLCFFERDDDSWRLARIEEVDESGPKPLFQLITATEDNQPDEEAYKASKIPMEKVTALQEGGLTPVKDLLEMTYLHDSVLLHQVRSRYWQNVIYTNIGAIVLALNPYDYTLPLYTDNNMPKYIEEKADALHGGSKLPTHTWSVAHDAYWSMRVDNRPQSILVSGESGAGKTEAAKIVTKYLAACSTYYASASDKEIGKAVTDKIQSASPILEAFGNAKTLRNDNSSRFGKFMKLQFTPEGLLHGCYTINYLLEKSRVVTHAKGERSYHTYYQILFGGSEEDKQKYKLDDPTKFGWMFEGIAIEDQDKDNDIFEYGEVRKAFNSIGFTEHEVHIIYAVIAGIMHLQTLKFVAKGEGSKLEDDDLETLRFVSDLWKIDYDSFYTELTSTTTKMRSESITKQLNIAQATEVRDALSKGLYDKIFQYIVDKLNSVLDKDDQTPQDSWIGLLDIFGFENFQKNSFEQLCINFANEQLQNHYNTCVFNRDMVEYENENIDVSSIDAPNNGPCLDLIGGRTGILALLTDQGRTGNDEKFLTSVLDKHKKHKNFIAPRIKNGTFGVVHYAGDVMYTAKDMRAKNVDPLKDSLKLLIRASQHEVLNNLIDAPEELTSRGAGLNTVAKFFQGSLNELISMIDETNPHWIRCVKPHSAKKKRMFNGMEVMSQLRCAGVLETVRIRQTGYAMRIVHANFWTRYKLLVKGEGAEVTDEANLANMKLVLDSIDFAHALDAQIGKTKVFLKDAAYKVMEGIRNSKLDSLALVVQRFAYAKSAMHKSHARLLLKSGIEIQRFAKAWYGSYIYRVKELEWYNKRIKAAMMLQQNTRARLSGKIVFAKKVQSCVTMMQTNMRAHASERVYRIKEQEHYHRQELATLLVQRFLRCKSAEHVYSEKAQDRIDELDAELEVFREVEEEKKRAEAARKKAIKDRIRAQKGIKAAADPAPGDEAAAEEEDEDVPATPTRTEEEDAATVKMDAQKVQQMLEKQMEFKKMQRQITALQEKVEMLQKEKQQMQKDMTEYKHKAAIAERTRRVAENNLHKEKTARVSLEQALSSRVKDQAKADEIQARLLEDAAGDWELMQSLSMARRNEIEETYAKLETQENECIGLTSTSIIRQPFGTEVDDRVKYYLSGLTNDLDSTIEPPKHPFQPTKLLDMVSHSMKKCREVRDVWKLLKEFQQYMMDMESSIPAENWLPREVVLEPMRQSLKIAEDVSRLVAEKKWEDKNDVPTSGLDSVGHHNTVGSYFNLGSDLDRLKKQYEPLIHKIQDRQNSAVHKINKMELLQQDVVLILSQMPDLSEIQDTIRENQAKLESQCNEGEKEVKVLKTKFTEMIKDQQEPLQQVERKRKEKEVLLDHMRADLAKHKKKVMEMFQNLLQTEETVAYILRDYEYLTQIRKKIEVEVGRRVQTAQSISEGLAAGAAVMNTESHLVEDVKDALNVILEELKVTVTHSHGYAHELNYQLMQKHFNTLESYYTDIVGLLYNQRDQLMQEEEKLESGSLFKGDDVKSNLMNRFRTKDQIVEKQQQTIQKLKDNIKSTYDTLMGIQKKFRLLLDWSHRNRVAEALSNYNKSRYGQLISTGAIPNAIDTFTWPELEELLGTTPKASDLIADCHVDGVTYS